MPQLGYSGFALASVFAPKLPGDRTQEWTHTHAKVGNTFINRIIHSLLFILIIQAGNILSFLKFGDFNIPFSSLFVGRH